MRLLPGLRLHPLAEEYWKFLHEYHKIIKHIKNAEYVIIRMHRTIIKLEKGLAREYGPGRPVSVRVRTQDGLVYKVLVWRRRDGKNIYIKNDYRADLIDALRTGIYLLFNLIEIIISIFKNLKFNIDKLDKYKFICINNNNHETLYSPN